jgi:alkylation response protein AidB-like acyl-CoA dehydrogenase
MNFQLSEEHLMIRQAARDFAQQQCLPGVIERDEKQQFPREQVSALADLGFMGMMVDPAYGGGGLDTISYVLAMEEISKVDASTSVCMSVNNSLVCYGLQEFGTEEQKRKYLQPLAQGKKDGNLHIGAFMLSEPEAGSDGGSLFIERHQKLDHQWWNRLGLPRDRTNRSRQRIQRNQLSDR